MVCMLFLLPLFKVHGTRTDLPLSKAVSILSKSFKGITDNSVRNSPDSVFGSVNGYVLVSLTHIRKWVI